jgi:hypothetical protein
MSEPTKPKIYFKNVKTGKKFEVLGQTKNEAGEIFLTLKGEGVPFPEKYNKERMVKLGYELVKEDA